MLNHFLARLDNDATAPGGILWPAFVPREPGSLEAAVRAAIIGVNLDREQRFLRCVQLAALVEESPLANRLRSRDPRVSYTRQFVRERLRPSGTVVIYSGVANPAPILSLTVNEQTPEMASWSVTSTGGQVTIVDDLGNGKTTSVTFAGGITNPLLLPLDRGHIQLSGVAPVAGDTWEVSFKRPGASWVPLALERLKGVNPVGLLDDEARAIFNRSPVSIDRLAAAVVGLADHA